MKPILKQLLLTVFIGVFVLIALKQKILIEKTLSVLSYPFLMSYNTCIFPLKKCYLFLTRCYALENNLHASEEQRQWLLSENIALHATLATMQECQEMIDFKKKYYNEYTVLAPILLKNIDHNHHFFIIEGGSNRGFKPNMVAVYYNCLVGRITDVYPFYSRVVLITDKTCKVGGVCSETKARGIHEGINNIHTTTFTFVSHLDELQKDDLIISTGEGLIFPRGFGLGRIVDFQRDGFSYRVTIKPLIELETLEYCYIFEKGSEFL